MDAALKRVFRIEDQRGFGGHVGRSGDMGNDPVALALNAAREHAAEDSFLVPGLAGRQLSRGRQAGHLCTRARSAGGSVVGLARAQNKIAAMILPVVWRAVELDVVDLRAVCSG